MRVNEELKSKGGNMETRISKPGDFRVSVVRKDVIVASIAFCQSNTRVVIGWRCSVGM